MIILTQPITDYLLAALTLRRQFWNEDTGWVDIAKRIYEMYSYLHFICIEMLLQSKTDISKQWRTIGIYLTSIGNSLMMNSIVATQPFPDSTMLHFWMCQSLLMIHELQPMEVEKLIDILLPLLLQPGKTQLILKNQAILGRADVEQELCAQAHLIIRDIYGANYLFLHSLVILKNTARLMEIIIENLGKDKCGDSFKDTFVSVISGLSRISHPLYICPLGSSNFGLITSTANRRDFNSDVKLDSDNLVQFALVAHQLAWSGITMLYSLIKNTIPATSDSPNPAKLNGEETKLTKETRIFQQDLMMLVFRLIPNVEFYRLNEFLGMVAALLIDDDVGIVPDVDKSRIWIALSEVVLDDKFVDLSRRLITVQWYLKILQDAKSKMLVVQQSHQQISAANMQSLESKSKL